MWQTGETVFDRLARSNNHRPMIFDSRSVRFRRNGTIIQHRWQPYSISTPTNGIQRQLNAVDNDEGAIQESSAVQPTLLKPRPFRTSTASGAGKQPLTGRSCVSCQSRSSTNMAAARNNVCRFRRIRYFLLPPFPFVSGAAANVCFYL